MADKMSNDDKANIRFSPFIGLSTAVALGSLASVGIGVYLLAGQVLKNLGNQTPLAYVLTVIFFIPAILVLAERAAVIRGRGGIFNLARSSDAVSLRYWTAWLLIFGYFCLTALFAWGAGSLLSIALQDFLGIEVDHRLLSVAAVAGIAAIRLLRHESAWNLKRALVYGSILIIFILTIRVWIRPVQITTYSVYLPSTDPLKAIPFLAIAMWGVSFILDHRDDLRQPRRYILAALGLPIFLGGFIGFITSSVLLQYSGVNVTSEQPLITLAAEIGPFIEGILLTAGFSLTLIGINQSMESSGRLIGEMVNDGFIAEQLLQVKGSNQPYLVITATAIAAVIVLLIPLSMITGASAAALLLAVAVTIGKDVFKRAPNLPDARRIKLPLHPLFPAVAAATSLAMAMGQPPENLLLVAGWAVLGFIYYSFYARRGAVKARQREVVVSKELFDHERVTNAVLAYIPDIDRATHVLAIGAQLARSRKTPLLALQIVEMDDEHHKSGEHPDRQHFLEFQSRLQHIPALEDIHVIPIVRLAPSVHKGIMATIWDEHVATTVISWPEDDNELTGNSSDDVSRLVRRAPCEVVVVRGEYPEEAADIIVPMTSVSHNQAALALGQELVRGTAGRVRAVGIIRDKASDEARTRARESVQASVSGLEDTTAIEIEIVETAGVQEGLNQSFGHYDLLILGASEEGFLRPTSFLGFPADIVGGSDQPGIVVKKREKTGDLWLRQLWESLFRILPKVGRQDRVSIYRGMQRNARADIDYYVLIVLAAGIAYLGLLLNSGAVIIGAMLIAPLMSPILASAHGIVMGNGRMTRTAGNSTLNGVILAITVAFFLSLALFALGSPLEPTAEILSRTSPNVLDLLVALLSGAAAAYAVSRSQLAAALPGVAIAAALVPPLCVVGYGLGTGQFDIAMGSSLLFITNLAAIVVAAAAVFLLLGFRPPLRLERGQQARQGLYIALAALLVVAVVLAAVTYVTNANSREVTKIESMVTSSVSPNQGEVVILNVSRQSRKYLVSYTIVDFTGAYDENDVDKLQRSIDEEVSDPVLLEATILLGNLTHSDGSVRPTPTETPTATAQATQTASPTPSPEATITSTPTRQESPTPTASLTSQPTDAPSTEVPEPTPTPTAVQATESPPPTEEPTPTTTSTQEPLETSTQTAEPTP